MKALNTYFIIIISIVLFSSTITVKAEKTDSIKIEKRIDSVYKNTNDSVFAFSTVFDAIKQSKEIGFKLERFLPCICWAICILNMVI